MARPVVHLINFNRTMGHQVHHNDPAPRYIHRPAYYGEDKQVKSYFITTKPTDNQRRLIEAAVVQGFDQDDLWSLATSRHGPAGSNVVEGLLRRGLLDYFEGNRGSTMRPTDAAHAYVASLKDAQQ